jgi:ABC-type transport system involved in multi-copper enzyme maturation permease subunit
LLADFRKMRRPLFLWLSLGMLVLSAFLTVYTQLPAAASLSSGKLQVEYLLKLQAAGDYSTSPVLSNKDQVATAISDARDSLARTQADMRFAGSTQHPLGALGLAVGFTASMVGAFLILLASAVHVSGEWSGKTIKEILVAEGRRGRLIWAKIVSLFVFGLWLLVCSYIGIALWGLVTSRWIHIDQVASTAEVRAWVYPMLWRAPLVILLFVVAAVALSLVLRHRIATIMAGAALLVASNFVASHSVSVTKYSPVGWIASFMGFKQREWLVYKLWANAPQRMSAIFGAIGVCALLVAFLVLAVVVMRKRDALA